MGEGDLGWQLSFGIQHANDLLKLCILDDHEGAVVACNPHSQKKAQMGGGVGDPRCEGHDYFSLWGLVQLTHLDVMGQVACGVLIIHVVNKLQWMPMQVCSATCLTVVMIHRKTYLWHLKQ